MVQAFLSPFVVCVDDDLGIRLGLKEISFCRKLLAQFDIVVDLAVEDEPNGSIPVRNGLMSGRG